ncbi:hypothetical protein FSP39_002350 [Pinctada imbricata]|uniref:Homeobox domain-containing protein n=1 Tax=Pinctada imbricata TaxID=66713 RepID=A0AA88XY91_PINIB|nr:hypothetical protein FSP39_002350 [Pinctada imbricata]
MAENMYSLMTSPASPAPLTITASTTLEDVINATILHPQPNPPTYLPNPREDPTTLTSTQTDSHMRTPVTTRTQPLTYDTSPAETRFDALFSLLDSPKKKTKLTSNPMFRDLQAILKADCSADATPNSLFQTLSTTNSNNSVISRELRLQQRLTKLNAYYPTQITQLSSFHKYQASMNRHQPLLRTDVTPDHGPCGNLAVSTMEEALTTTHQPAPTQYSPVINSAPTQYQPTSTQYPPSTNSAPTQKPPSNNSAPTQYPPATNSAPTQYPSSTNSAPTQYSPVINSTPTQYSPVINSAPTQHSPATTSAPTQYSPVINSTPTQYSPVINSALTHYSPAINSAPTQHSPATTSAPTQYSPVANSSEAPFRLNLRTRPSLSKQVIRLMEVWYHAHIDHPYPDTQDVETLATAGNITEEQVKKWFANKRNRSRNIRPISQIVRRKRQIQAAAANRIIRVPSFC